MTRRFRVGCSGWHYRDWAGRIYPKDLPKDQWLAAYARQFDTVELNNSFYRLPEADQFDRWRREVPRGFELAVKASRFLTHFKRLIDPEEPLDRLFSRMRALGTHLGPVLYQLPPGWNVDTGRLSAFLDALPGDARHVVEFRDPSWYTPEVFRLMERRGVALCLHDMAGSATERRRIGPFVYVRFHGAGAKYGGAYSEARLRSWADWLTAQRDERCDVYTYFNNDVGGHAPRDALGLRRLLEA